MAKNWGCLLYLSDSDCSICCTAVNNMKNNHFTQSMLQLFQGLIIYPYLIFWPSSTQKEVMLLPGFIWLVIIRQIAVYSELWVEKCLQGIKKLLFIISNITLKLVNRIKFTLHKYWSIIFEIFLLIKDYFYSWLFSVFLLCVGDTELRSVQESEELLVNVAATINNLSFYQEDSSAIRQSQLAIAKCKFNGERYVLLQDRKERFWVYLWKRMVCSLCVCDLVMLKLVLSSSLDAILEATRVYGNLSQSKDVRDVIMQNRGIWWTQTLSDKQIPFRFIVCHILCTVCHYCEKVVNRFPC